MSYKVTGSAKAHLVSGVLCGVFLVYSTGKIDQYLQSLLTLAWYFTGKKFRLVTAVRNLVAFNLGSVLFASFIEFVAW